MTIEIEKKAEGGVPKDRSGDVSRKTDKEALPTDGQDFNEPKQSTLQRHLSKIRRNWRIFGVGGSIAAFAISTLLSWHSFQRSLESAENVAVVSLSRDLRREFREKDPCGNVLTLVTACEPVYKSNGGPLDYYEINDCLNFFEDVAFYVEQGALSAEIVDHFFGTAVLEVTVPQEMATYIARVAAQEPGAYDSLVALSTTLQSRKRHRGIEQRFQVCVNHQPR